MAERTKTRVNVNAPAAPNGAGAEREAVAAVPERPAWMPSPKASKGNGRPVPAVPSATLPGRDAADVAQSPESLSLGSRFVAWYRSGAATAYGLSLLLHGLLLLGMALWILPQLSESARITTVVESDVEAPQPFDTMNDVQLESPAGSENVVIPQVAELLPQEAELNVLEHQFLRDVTAAESQGEGGQSDIGKGGFRLLEPKNAVKAGSFTAWTIPIPERPGEQPKAGESPRPGQDYHIVIQVKVPRGRTVYNISDLSGQVIGTDGYIQIIPAQAFVQDEEGRLTRAKLGRRMPVVDGVAQILIRVPGAAALVKDTIRVRSKLLDENQTLELVFGQRR